MNKFEFKIGKAGITTRYHTEVTDSNIIDTAILITKTLQKDEEILSIDKLDTIKPGTVSITSAPLEFNTQDYGLLVVDSGEDKNIDNQKIELPGLSDHVGDYKLITKSTVERPTYRNSFKLGLDVDMPEGYKEIKEIEGISVHGKNKLLLPMFWSFRRYDLFKWANNLYPGLVDI